MRKPAPSAWTCAWACASSPILPGSRRWRVFRWPSGSGRIPPVFSLLNQLVPPALPPGEEPRGAPSFWQRPGPDGPHVAGGRETGPRSIPRPGWSAHILFAPWPSSASATTLPRSPRCSPTCLQPDQPARGRPAGDADQPGQLAPGTTSRGVRARPRSSGARSTPPIYVVGQWLPSSTVTGKAVSDGAIPGSSAKRWSRLIKCPAVIGVTPPGFAGALQIGESADICVPLANASAFQPGPRREQSPALVMVENTA